MAERRLHVPAEQMTAGDVAVRGDQHHYLFRVLRLAVGDTVVVFDGDGREAEATVAVVTSDDATLRVGKIRVLPAQSGPRMIALQALIKGERMEWCVQKLVELGVDQVIPMQTARSVVRLTESRAASRRTRLASIASDAARQCGRSTVPTIAAVASLNDAVAGSAEADLKLVFATETRSTSLARILDGATPSSVAFAIGPEGGFTEAELQTLQDAGFQAAGLGPRVLRAETASIAALAALGFALGDLGSPCE